MEVFCLAAVTLLVCWLPYISLCFYETFSGRRSPAVSSALSTWLVLSSAAINPWISCMTQTRYRTVLFRSFRTFSQMCSGMSLGLNRQNAVFHLNAANNISAVTIAAETRQRSGDPLD
ncbi:neuromedin-K receptor [Kryptolebias marmoratus]|uniref:neuromedin-K receptor n=1 Tax=Kryptolebias marmoratus TaxID=37003 RepID=UPI000D530360|nr:neuromedin-K receptor [Kryptolebias marmoratus]